MERLIFTLLILVTLYPIPAESQEVDSLVSNLFELYESASEQEGAIYIPPGRKLGFIAGSEMVNERRLQTSLKNDDYPVIVTTAVNLAWINFDQGNFEKVIANFDIAITAQEKF